MDLANHLKYSQLLNIDFKAILVFIAFVESGDLYSTSLIVGCSPSSVSLQLKRVRCYFHKPLFTREGRNLNPTEYAVTVSNKLKDCFISFDEIYAVNCYGDNVNYMKNILNNEKN